MTDIVERLRADAAAERGHAEVSGAMLFFERAAVWEKAATEIENLRVIVDEEDQRSAAAAAEIETLRTALENLLGTVGESRIRSASRDEPGEYITTVEDWAVRDARAAIAKGTVR